MKCKDCKFFVQGERHSGTCLKQPYQKSRYETIYRKKDGTPYTYYVTWGKNACKQNFERKEDNV